ncbi:hypothetical protein QR680_012975 [Steinernema hermaphroditum]|uniref:SXP/RAL-2 family protein Ani s 5-like cation-binding domain-containing protein n=1 Tax=Steinernema hermaphroditum TaxID=289476 RepID=A0AA39M1Q5_9BILA|nr:hypothetical protein QR680_012975 [Steinernema hermaphroditum]
MIFAFSIFLLVASFTSAQQHPQIPCGLPPFVERMSEPMAARLRQIWQNYEAGQGCASEQQQTFALVHSLSDAERTHVFGLAPPKPTASQDGIPMFVRTSDAKFQQQFEKLWRSTTLADEDKFKTLEALAQQGLNSQQLADYHQWMMAVKSQKSVIDQRIDRLSDEARQILAAVTQLRAQEQKILAQVSPSVTIELKGLL